MSGSVAGGAGRGTGSMGVSALGVAAAAGKAVGKAAGKAEGIAHVSVGDPLPTRPGWRALGWTVGEDRAAARAARPRKPVIVAIREGAAGGSAARSGAGV